MNALILEDEWIISEELKEILMALGFNQVLQVDNESDFWSGSRQMHCQLIVADVNISGEMLGIQLAKKMSSEYEDAEIVFITALNATLLKKELKNVPHAGYLVKPFVAQEVRKVIQSALKMVP